MYLDSFKLKSDQKKNISNQNIKLFNDTSNMKHDKMTTISL